MTLVQLKHLLALADTGSFSKTALKLHLTQPALTRSIKSLEEELGQPLFDRVGRKNELTAFGESIVQKARLVIESATDLRQTGQQLLRGETGQIRIGLGSGPGALLMTPLLRYMATHHAKAQIEISRGPTALQIQALRDRQLDLAIVDIRSLKPATDLHIDVLPEMTGAFMCRKGHPLARKRKVTFGAIREYPIASSPLSDEVARILIDRYGPEAHPEHCVTLRCEEIASLVDVARNTDAVVLAIQAAAPDLVKVAVTPPLAANARFGIVRVASRAESPLAQRLHQVVIDLWNKRTQ